MPVSLGAQPEHGFDQPLGLLSDCHRRIERFLDVMLRVLERSEGCRRAPTAEERDAVETALRYFDAAAPRHTQDEEQSLFPRLRASNDPAAREALARVDELEADHRRADVMHGEVKQLWRGWLNTGDLPPADVPRLRTLLQDLRDTYVRHIALEDNELFPLAARVLSADQLAALGREMAARRGLPGGGTNH